MASGEVLLILDMISTFGFEDGQALAREGLKVAPTIAKIKARLKRGKRACIYINDNFGQWNEEFSDLVRSVEGSRGQAILEVLRPAPEDYFILKPKHSAFYQTPLPQLLNRLQTRRLIITGQAAEACVMLTAMDGHMRDFKVHTPSNAIASASSARKAAALTILRHSDINTRAV